MEWALDVELPDKTQYAQSENYQSQNGVLVSNPTKNK
jgi:hypothetical protein